MKTSLVLTVLNEARSLPVLLDSIAAQTQRPDEVVACDGGSRDETAALLRGEARFPVRVIEAPGANISRGRNLAIAAATGDVILCTDAGVRLHAQWVESLVAAMAQGAAPIVAGFFVPDPRTTFEVAMSATVLPELRDVRPETFLPSSRSVAFRKSAWEAAGGYPEWLDYCEDLIFDLKLREVGGAFAFAPEAVAFFRPRGSLRAFFKQYYLYARGDGKANLFLKRHLIRYATYLVALPALLAGLALGATPVKLACLAMLIAGAIAYTRAPYRRLATLARDLPALEKLKAAALVPVIRIVGDTAKMLGYPAGAWWRLTRRGA